MNEIVSLIEGQAVTTTLAVAEGTEIEHASVIKLVRTYLTDLEEFGRVRFETRPFETAGGTQHREIAILNEDQSILTITYMRNSEIVRNFKKRLVKEFRNLRNESAFKIPKTYAEALMLAATQAGEIEEQAARIVAQKAKLEIDTPKAELIPLWQFAFLGLVGVFA